MYANKVFCALGLYVRRRFPKSDNANARYTITKHKRAEIGVDRDDRSAFGGSAFKNRLIAGVGGHLKNGGRIMTRGSHSSSHSRRNTSVNQQLQHAQTPPQPKRPTCASSPPAAPRTAAQP